MGSKCRRFEGKTALITGAAAGMGRATVQRFADEGLETVILVDRDVSGATVEKEKVEACGGRAYVLECDVADPASVVSMGKEAEKLVDHLDVIASGNSASSFFLNNVTFLTSMMFLSHKKSNLVSFENLNSGLIILTDLNSSKSLLFKPCSTILFAL